MEETRVIIGVLDDNHALCHVIETTLALAGHEVSAYTDPLEFMMFIQHTDIDDIECIIVDFHLSGEKTGIDVLFQVREKHPHLPALVISGDSLPQTAWQGLSHVAFCKKPFHFSTLLTALSNLQDAKKNSSI